MSTNTPATIWRPTDGLSDYTSSGVFDIVDPSGVFLVDTLGNNVVDTGVLANLIPATTWQEDDSL